MRVSVDIAADGMAAFVRVQRGEALSCGVSGALEQARISYGIDEAAVAALDAACVAGDFTMERVQVARGLPPIRGFDGYFTPAFEPGLRPGHVREDGTMDFFDRELLKTVQVGEQVGHITPPTRGEQGCRVDGTPLPPQAGKPCALTLSASLSTDEHGQVSARHGGAIVYIPQRSLDIVGHVVHGGDVDLRTGHLDMQGSLLIKGNVTRGFRVLATGDLEVRGQVAGGLLRAGGNVRVHGGILGGDAGSVDATGDVSARNAESVEIRAGGRISLKEAVHSQLHAEHIVISGHVRGGRASAEQSVVVADAGNAQGMTTSIEAAVPRRPTDALKQLLANAKTQRFASHRASETHAGAGDFAQDAARGKGGKGARQARDGQRDSLAHKIAYARRRAELAESAFIVVHGTLYEGSVIAIAGHAAEIRETTKRTRFFLDTAHHTLRTEKVSP